MGVLGRTSSLDPAPSLRGPDQLVTRDDRSRREPRDLCGKGLHGRPHGYLGSKLLATWPSCKVVVATRLHSHELEAAAHRALQIAWFTTPAMLDDFAELKDALSPVEGLDAAAIVEAAEHDSDVADAFAKDREVARSAAGSPTEAQGKHAMEGDLVRYTAPSLLMTRTDGVVLEAGGFQPVEAYDVIIANSDPNLERTASKTAAEVLAASPWPLAPVEVAAVLAPPLTPPDTAAAEAELIGLNAAGQAKRITAGNGALYSIS